eukprot:376300_1
MIYLLLLAILQSIVYGQDGYVMQINVRVGLGANCLLGADQVLTPTAGLCNAPVNPQLVDCWSRVSCNCPNPNDSNTWTIEFDFYDSVGDCEADPDRENGVHDTMDASAICNSPLSAYNVCSGGLDNLHAGWTTGAGGITLACQQAPNCQATPAQIVNDFEEFIMKN